MFRCSVPVGSRALLALAVAGLSFTGTAQADLKPGYATGVGANKASLIIDFAFVSGDAYLFEYYFDGTTTGEQMLLDLDAAGGLTVHRQFFSFGGPPSIFIDGFSFDGESEVPVFEGANGENWSYWGNSDYASDPSDWSIFNLFGPSGRTLTDGVADGWGLNVSQFASPQFTPTNDEPGTFSSNEISQVSASLQIFPVPEPTSAALLAIGGLALTRRRVK